MQMFCQQTRQDFYKGTLQVRQCFYKKKPAYEAGFLLGTLQARQVFIKEPKQILQIELQNILLMIANTIIQG
jgi:hypothetical protein